MIGIGLGLLRFTLSQFGPAQYYVEHRARHAQVKMLPIRSLFDLAVFHFNSYHAHKIKKL